MAMVSMVNDNGRSRCRYFDIDVQGFRDHVYAAGWKCCLSELTNFMITIRSKIDVGILNGRRHVLGF